MEVICSAFWHHTNVRSDNRVFPCCRYKAPIQKFDGNLVTVLDSAEYKQLRERNLQGITDPNCQKCYYEEQLGKKSLRQEFNEHYDTDSVGLEFLEIGFDNICNLTCDGCWSEFSSAWAKKTDPNTVHIKSTEEITHIPNSIKKILFLGGEPLMTNRHIKFLKKVSNPSEVEVIYNTNGTFLLDNDEIELLHCFKQVSFIVSIDGYGQLNEQVRQGSNWTDIVSFIDQIRRERFVLSVNTVLHANNWHGIGELADYVNLEQLPWTVNMLTYPKHLDVNTVANKDSVRQAIASAELPNKSALLKHLDYDRQQ